MSVPKIVEIMYAMYQVISKIRFVRGICRKKSKKRVRVQVSPKFYLPHSPLE